MTRRLAIALFVLSVSLSAGAQPAADWLPPRMQDSVAAQLAERLGTIGIGDFTNAKLMEAALIAVRSMRARLDDWGQAEVRKRAPALDDLKLPSSGNVDLDAMNRYNMCVAVLFLQHENRANVQDPDQRLDAAMGLTAMTLTVIYLRQPYLAAGKTDAELEAFLTSPAMDAVLARVQKQPQQKQYVESQCRPVVDALLN